jgi:hypothetical protein
MLGYSGGIEQGGAEGEAADGPSILANELTELLAHTTTDRVLGTGSAGSTAADGGSLSSDLVGGLAQGSDCESADEPSVVSVGEWEVGAVGGQDGGAGGEGGIALRECTSNLHVTPCVQSLIMNLLVSTCDARARSLIVHDRLSLGWQSRWTQAW